METKESRSFIDCIDEILKDVGNHDERYTIYLDADMRPIEKENKENKKNKEGRGLNENGTGKIRTL